MKTKLRHFMIKWLCLTDRVLQVIIYRLSNNEKVYKGNKNKKKQAPKNGNNMFKKRKYIKIKTRESVGNVSDRQV